MYKNTNLVCTPIATLTLIGSLIGGADGAASALGTNLPGPNGITWFSFINYGSAGFGFADASGPFGSDAFDGAGFISVNGLYYTNPDGDYDLTGNTITSDPAVVSGMTVSVQYTALTSSQTLRSLVTLTNSGSTTLSGVSISYTSNWGSDSSTIIQATSSGDTTYGTDDVWSITSDFSDSDPVNITAYGNANLDAITGTVHSAAGTEGLGLTYNLDFAPGQTRHLLFFHDIIDTTPNAIAEAEAVYDNPLTGERIAGLPSQGIANFAIPEPSSTALLGLGGLAWMLRRKR